MCLSISPAPPHSYLYTPESTTNVSLLLPLGVADPGAQHSLSCCARCCAAAPVHSQHSINRPAPLPASQLPATPHPASPAGFLPLYAHIMAVTCAVGGVNASDAGYAVAQGIVPPGGARQHGSHR